MDYLAVLDKLLVKGRSVVRETKNYKVYLPIEFNDIWERLYRDGRRVDVLILLPKNINYVVDKVLLRGRKITGEHTRFKIYLDRKYDDLWNLLSANNAKIDLVIVLK